MHEGKRVRTRVRVRRKGEGMKAWKLEDNKTEKKCFIFVRVLRSFFYVPEIILSPPLKHFNTDLINYFFNFLTSFLTLMNQSKETFLRSYDSIWK